MRSFIIAICLAAVMVAGSLIYTSSIERISTELSNGNQLVTSLVDNRDFSSAAQVLSQIKAHMEDKKTLLAATGNHEEINKIELYMAELEEYINGKNRVDALAKCRALQQVFEHLPKNYKLKAENIL